MKRIITGLGLILIGVYVISVQEFPLFCWLFLVGQVVVYEIANMCESSSYKVRRWIMHGVFSFVMALSWLYPIEWQTIQWWLAPIIALLYAIMLTELQNKQLVFLRFPSLLSIKYALIVSVGFSHVMLITFLEKGFFYLWFGFLSIWACDIFALYGGKTFGKHALSAVSPNKTVEGTVIGMVSAGLVIGVFCYSFGESYLFVMLAMVIALVSQLGDLYESLVKRTLNCKDSSQLLPGHGGFYDRADSTIFVFPILYYLLLLI